MKNLLLLLTLLCVAHVSSAQLTVDAKKLPAKRTSITPKIDGVIEEDVWSNAPVADKFIQNRPTPGLSESYDKRTEVRFLYDDFAVYVAARMYDHPDSIARELVGRDNIGNADFVGVVFDTFKDGINGYGFFVTAAGVQFDAKYSQTGGEDPNWNAVWESAVKRDELGWVAEFKIPYSALRFASTDVQNWGLNITRKRTGFNQQFFWNPVDPRISGFINQSGVWEGLKDIKAPIRLSFSPYVSTFVSHFPNNVPGVKNTTSSINGGMDVKYGINQSFTLDLTLIPDFGQVQSDNRILNLTPFEVRYDERRQFFTEGTELFSKGDLFYSRRIGNDPSYYHNIESSLKPGEVILSSPSQSKLINATKISGRTAKGLGIGFFNAITNKMFAEVVDANGVKREIESQPLTNYNVFVVDQTLKNASSVSLVNTNVIRQGSAYDANVTAFLFDLKDKKQTYGVRGDAKMSYITNPVGPSTNGYSYSLAFGKQSGNFLWEYEQELADQNYDPSDMGFYTNNNFFDQSLEAVYKVYKPGKWYNQMQGYIASEYSRKFKAGDYQYFGIYPGYYVQFKNFWSAELNLQWNAEGNDFYESRGMGVFKEPESYGAALYINPNRTKAYNFGGNIRFLRKKLMNGANYNYYFFQNLRLSDKFAIGLDLGYNPSFNYVNWVARDGNRAVFSRYDRNTVENSFDTKFSFNDRMGINARVRHYWSDRRNKEFFYLNSDGRLDPYNGAPINNADRTYNVFNIDLVYTWVFAPGSELSVTYKNAAESSQQLHRKRYFNNFDYIVNAPQINSLSIKVLYFIDYLDLKKK